MSWVALGVTVAGTAASAAGSAGQKGAAGDAADAQSAGIGQGIDALTKAYGSAQGYLNPYAKTGNTAQRRLAQMYGLEKGGGGRQGRYKRDIAKIWANRPDVGLPDTSQYNLSGLDDKWDPSGIVSKYDPAGITANYAGLAGKYDPSGIVSKYDVAGLGDRVNVEQDPGYKFRRDQGIQAQERQAAARGTLQGGGFAKDLEEYSQGLASQEYGNAYQRLLGENETGFEREYGANQLGYGREVDSYGREMAGNELGFGREYGANELEYGRERELNEAMYGRTIGENDREYGRQTDEYGRRLQQLGLQYEPLRSFADQGRQTASEMGGLATNFGSNVASLYSQQGGAQAAGITGKAAANSQMLNSLGNLGYLGLLYGGQGSGAGANPFRQQGGAPIRNVYPGGAQYGYYGPPRPR